MQKCKLQLKTNNSVKYFLNSECEISDDTIKFTYFEDGNKYSISYNGDIMLSKKGELSYDVLLKNKEHTEVTIFTEYGELKSKAYANSILIEHKNNEKVLNFDYDFYIAGNVENYKVTARLLLSEEK